MNDHPTNNPGRDPDSGGGRISSQRRDLANIALETVAIGRTIERLSKLVDRVPSTRRQLEILLACDQIAQLRSTVEATEMHLREVAGDTRVEMHVVPRKVGLLDRFAHWILGDA